MSKNVTTQKVQSVQHPQMRDVNATQRVSLAIKMRAQKVKYDDIAKACGYGSAGAAHKAVMRELERIVSENTEELRREELDSLERLELECWKRLADKEFTKSMLFAVDRILAIKERRARLMGTPFFDRDRKSTRLNSSHTVISYAVFCLKKKKKKN